MFCITVQNPYNNILLNHKRLAYCGKEYFWLFVLNEGWNENAMHVLGLIVHDSSVHVYMKMFNLSSNMVCECT